jgi:hypothetical protein
MLPCTSEPGGSGVRFGVHAMQILINELLRKGADRKRLIAKAFGAGAVNRAPMQLTLLQAGQFRVATACRGLACDATSVVDAAQTCVRGGGGGVRDVRWPDAPHAAVSGAKNGAVTVVQRTSSDLRLKPHLHVFLDGTYHVLDCPKCHGRMKLLAMITDDKNVKRAERVRRACCCIECGQSRPLAGAMPAGREQPFHCRARTSKSRFGWPRALGSQPIGDRPLPRALARAVRRSAVHA